MQGITFFFIFVFCCIAMSGLDLNIDALNERTANDKVLAGALLSDFVAEMPTYRSDLLDFSRSDDHKSMACCLHKLKGCVGIFGFDSIVESVNDIENMANEGRKCDYESRVEDLFARISDKVEKLYDYLTK